MPLVGGKATKALSTGAVVPELLEDDIRGVARFFFGRVRSPDCAQEASGTTSFSLQKDPRPARQGRRGVWWMARCTGGGYRSVDEQRIELPTARSAGVGSCCGLLLRAAAGVSQSEAGACELGTTFLTTQSRRNRDKSLIGCNVPPNCRQKQPPAPRHCPLALELIQRGGVAGRGWECRWKSASVTRRLKAACRQGDRVPPSEKNRSSLAHWHRRGCRRVAHARRERKSDDANCLPDIGL